MFAAKPNLFDERLLWATGALVATLLLGALILALVERWRKKQMSDDPDTTDPLTLYRRMYDRGELSKEEYQRIRAKLANRYYKLPDQSPPADVDDFAPEKDKDDD